MNNDDHFLLRFLNRDVAFSGEERAMFGAAFNEHSVGLTLSAEGYSRDGRLAFSGGECVFEGLLPGLYELIIEGGRCLWSGELTAEMLLSDESTPLELAADSGDGEEAPSFRVMLIPNECEMLVYSGLESGRVRVRVIDS